MLKNTLINRAATKKIYQDLGGFDGLMDAEKLIFNRLQTFNFHNYFALAIAVANLFHEDQEYRFKKIMSLLQQICTGN